MIETRDSLQDVLSQEEIDALLAPAETTPPVFNTLLKPKEEIKTESLPAFERHLDVFARTLITSLRRLTEGQDIFVTVRTFIAGQLGTYLDTVQIPAMLGFFIDKEKNIPGLVSIDPMLAYTLIDMALGGRRGTAAMQLEDRRYTKIERTILEKFMKALIQNLQDAFQTCFIYEGIDTNPQTALIDAASSDMRIARLSVQIDGRSGLFDLVFPTLAVQKLEIESELSDQTDILKQEWNQKLGTSVAAVPLEVEAVLDQKVLPFKSILEWKSGQTLPLSFFVDKPIQLMCQNIPLFQGRLNPHQKNVQIILDKTRLKGA